MRIILRKNYQVQVEMIGSLGYGFQPMVGCGFTWVVDVVSCAALGRNNDTALPFFVYNTGFNPPLCLFSVRNRYSSHELMPQCLHRGTLASYHLPIGR